jgi:uncharacterized protein YjbI with pentapeptide repeats
MANREQLAILRQGVDVWNKWRKENPAFQVDLSNASFRIASFISHDDFPTPDSDSSIEIEDGRRFGMDFRGINLSKASLIGTDFYNADLSGANLSKSILGRANLGRCNLNKASLNGAYLVNADLTLATLKETDCTNANLWGARLLDANLSEANLQGANLIFVNFLRANLSGANLEGTNLNGAMLVETKIDKTKISKSSVYGISTWDLVGEFEEQKDLVISRKADPIITVDKVEVAQFVYLLLNNQKIRNVIDTVTSKAVLILGRFCEERKQVLDTLKDALRKRGFVPILFDFEPSNQRDLTETIQLLANLAKFVIADITDAKSIPQELSHIIPLLPSVPIQPILSISKEKEYAMFEHWRSFTTVLPEFLYQDKQDLLDNLEAKIIQPIETWRQGQNEVIILQNRIKELEEKLRGSK